MVTIEVLGEEYHDYINDCYPGFVFLLLLELLVNATVMKKKRYYTVPDTISSIGSGMSTLVWNRIISIPILKTIEFAVAIYVYKSFRLIDVSEDSKLAWIICFFCIDFSYYWFHRLAHEINIFWATHVTHHSSEKYNYSTALRQSVFQIYTSWIFFVPYGLFIPPQIFFFHKQFNTIYQFWIHTQMVPKLGFIEYIFNTPSAHRVHHGRNPKYLDKNYAGTLIIWDRLFGTYQEEDDNEPVYYGLVHPLKSNDPTWSQFHHWVEMYQAAKGYSKWSDRVKVFIYGPGWNPTYSNRLGNAFDNPTPSEKDDQERDPRIISTVMNTYIFLHYLIISVLALVLLKFEDKSNPSSISLVTNTFIFVYLSITSFGSMFDGKKLSYLLELVRITLFLAYTWNIHSSQVILSLRFIYYLSFIFIFFNKYGRIVFNQIKKYNNNFKKQKSV